MSSLISASSLGNAAKWTLYRVQQEAVRLPLIMAHRLASGVARARGNGVAPADRELVRRVRWRYRELLRHDFANAEQGKYEFELLFDVPWAEYKDNLPSLARDLPKIIARASQRRADELPEQVDLECYPHYYRRTFHWQSDGYFSAQSARLYDVGVEILFVGCADVMRRQTLAAVVERLAADQRRASERQFTLLDVGCGTGRFLLQAARTLPRAELIGLDLSPWYVAHARTRLRAQTPPARRVRVEVGNAERLPFDDASLDAVTSIFMLHELPRAVRRTVLGEMLRVLKPGGWLVLQDSAQPSESPELGPLLEQFPKDMHEPYFRDYLADDLGQLVAQMGFEPGETASHFMSKVVTARRPL